MNVYKKDLHEKDLSFPLLILTIQTKNTDSHNYNDLKLFIPTSDCEQRNPALQTVQGLSQTNQIMQYFFLTNMLLTTGVYYNRLISWKKLNICRRYSVVSLKSTKSAELAVAVCSTRHRKQKTKMAE